MVKKLPGVCPTMSTERFLLRPLSVTDENDIFLLRSDERVLRYTDMVKAETIKDAQQFINKINNGIAAGKCAYWAITTIDSGKFAGTICLWNFNDEKTTAEIGYALLPEYFGKGIMQEIMPISISYAFKELKLKIISADVHPDNIRSVQLLKKFGFSEDRGNSSPKVNMYQLSETVWEDRSPQKKIYK
jgi:ribosomal-protein-alanine N-acetyltransferase